MSTFVVLLPEAQPPENEAVNFVYNSFTQPFLDRKFTGVFERN
jgi:hypothetical protein